MASHTHKIQYTDHISRDQCLFDLPSLLNDISSLSIFVSPLFFSCVTDRLSYVTHMHAHTRTHTHIHNLSLFLHQSPPALAPPLSPPPHHYVSTYSSFTLATVISEGPDGTSAASKMCVCSLAMASSRF